MKKICSFAGIFVLFFLFCGPAFGAKAPNAFLETYERYEVELLKTIKASDGRVLSVERAWVRPKDERVGYTFERIQIRDSEGFVLAYTPTRMQAVLVCKDIRHCWVFMWKTVYPLPAIFKLNADLKGWVHQKNPVIKYSRSGYSGEGFTEVVDPLFGLYGLVFYLYRNLWFFLFIGAFSFIFTLQVLKYHDLDPRKKDLLRLALSLLHFVIPPWIPLEPYIISAGIILFMDIIGTVYFGIASVLSIFVIMTVIILTSLWVARTRRSTLEGVPVRP